jgi:hypothetical protein
LLAQDMRCHPACSGCGQESSWGGAALRYWLWPVMLQSSPQLIYVPAVEHLLTYRSYKTGGHWLLLGPQHPSLPAKTRSRSSCTPTSRSCRAAQAAGLLMKTPIQAGSC